MKYFFFLNIVAINIRTINNNLKNIYSVAQLNVIDDLFLRKILI